MPEQDRSDPTIPNRSANQEPAEGSRENVNVESGITNRPIEEEEREQQSIPPRGEPADREETMPTNDSTLRTKI